MKAFKIILLVFCSVIMFIIVNQYLFCPVYSFNEPTSFSGDSIYNPYAGMIAGNWKKCNFHAHVNCWNGVTNGKGNATQLEAVYTKLGYDVHSISNYQHIDTTYHNKAGYITAYEHGYNVLKSHQLVLGSNHVFWKDYLLPQTSNNKQQLLNELQASAPDGLVIINHPEVRDGYSVDDLKRISNFSLMEVLNPACNSSACWDAALSSGKPIFAVGNDDTHDVADSGSVGRNCTWVNASQTNQENIINAMKAGNSYAMSIGKNLAKEIWNGNTDNVPALTSFTVKNDSVFAAFNITAKQLNITGSNGRILKTINDENIITFKLNKQEPYARITADFGDGTSILLNPVFRYHEAPLYQSLASINNMQTFWLRCAAVLVLATWFWFVSGKLQPKAQRKKFRFGLPRLNPRRSNNEKQEPEVSWS